MDVHPPIEEKLRRLGSPEQPRDGDCLTWALAVTDMIIDDYDGLPAETVWVTAYDERDVILFIHKATRVLSWMIDVTARQFSPELPLYWVATENKYIEDLASATGAALITISPLADGLHLPSRSA